MLIASARLGPYPARRPAGHRQDLPRPMLRAGAGARFRAHPVHAGPDAGRHPRLQPVQLPDQPVHADPRPDLLRAAARRRDQPHAAQDAGGPARGDAGARGHHRRRDPPPARPLHGDRDPESDRAAGRLSAARGAARPLPVQAQDGLSRAPRRRRRSSPATAPASARRGPRIGGSSRGSTPRRSPRRSRRSRRSRWSTTSSTMSSPWSARPARRPTSKAAPPRAPRRCSPAPRGRAPRSTGATMSSPTTSRRWRPPVLRHRVLLSAAAEIEGRPVEDVIAAADRGDRGAALIYPTRRTILLAAAIAPAALVIGLLAPAYWLARPRPARPAARAGRRSTRSPARRLGDAEASCEGPRAVSVGESFAVTRARPLRAARARPRLEFALGVAGPVAAPFGLRTQGRERAVDGGAGAIVLQRRAARHRAARPHLAALARRRSAWSGSSAGSRSARTC